ncbi:MAG: LysM peptidoglycan-binding domain-containing protein [Verrucomicrobiota bacterium]
MKHILNFALVVAMATCAAEAQERDPRIPAQTSALIERILSERLAQHDQRLSSLESRTGYLERLFHGIPTDQEETQAPEEVDEPAEKVAEPRPQQNAHIIAKGETLSSIARMHHVSVADLARTNGISIYDTIYIDDALVIPDGGQQFPESQPRNEPIPVSHEQMTGNEAFHRVSPGDTLSKIAKLHQKPIGYLMQLNGLSNPDQIKVGELIYLTGEVHETEIQTRHEENPREPLLDATMPGEEETFHYYDVATGDTLSTIAETFFTTVQELRKLNSLAAQATIQVGQQLIVPTKKYFDYLREEGVLG